jgi:hypothetical protein
VASCLDRRAGTTAAPLGRTEDDAVERTIIALALPFALATQGCSHSTNQPPPTAPESAAAAASNAPSGIANVQPGSPAAEGRTSLEDDGGAKLVVARDVVQACPNLRVMQMQALSGASPPDDFWIMVLDGVSECMNAGGLAGPRHIAVIGESPRRDVVRLVLAAKGAPMDRVEVGTLRPARICDPTGCRRAPSLVQIRLVR